MSFFDTLAGKRQPMFPTPNLSSMPVNRAPRPITMPVGPMTPVSSPQRSVKDFSMGKGLPSSPSISLPSIPSIPSIEIPEEVDTTEELNALLQRKRQLEAELQPLWPDAILWNDIKRFLEKNNFTCFWTQDIIGLQIDSIWINDKYEM